MSASSSSSSEREVAKEKKEEKPKETKKSSKKGEKESGATGKKKDSQNGKKKDSKKDIKVEVDSANAERTLLRNVSEKLKVDTARKLKQSPSKTDVQNEIQSPRNPTQNAMGKSEAHPELFMACFEGDLAKVKKLLAEDSKLVRNLIILIRAVNGRVKIDCEMTGCFVGVGPLPSSLPSAPFPPFLIFLYSLD